MLNVLACEDFVNSIGVVAVPIMDLPIGTPVCPSCGKSATASAKFCGECGNPLAQERKTPTAKAGHEDRQKKWVFVTIFAVLGVVVVAAMLGKIVTAPNSEMVEKTKAFWASMRQIEEQANAALKDKKLGKYPLTDSGQFDFSNFSTADFDSLERFHAENAKIAQEVADKIGKLPLLNIDPDLLKFKIELRENWATDADVDAEFVQLLVLLEQQKVNFTSNEAYAVRTLAALAGQPQVEEKYRESQIQIDAQAAKWKAAQERAEAVFKRVERREQEIQTLLVQKYQSEFK